MEEFLKKKTHPNQESIISMEISTIPEPNLQSRQSQNSSNLPSPKIQVQATVFHPFIKDSSLSTLNATGKYIVSGVKNCPSSRIVQGKVYDTEKYKKVPGPGSYNLKESLNGSGKYFNSKLSDSRCRIFSRSIKKN